MKLRNALIIAAVITLANGTASAAEHIWEDPGGWSRSVFYYDTEAGPRFNANELSLDLFGSYLNPERKFNDLFETNIRHGTWGGGVGLNYFFTRELGIEADVNMSAHEGRIVDQVLGNLVLRIPIESARIAPYIFGGGGRSVSPDWDWLADAGVGLDFRLSRVTGIFADARYIWHDEKTYDRLLIRTGLRLVF